MSRNLYHAAYSYLEECLSVDLKCIAALSDELRSEKEVCGELTAMATYYRIIRNFSSTACEEPFRLSPVLTELRPLKLPASDEAAIALVDAFVDALTKHYDRRLISAATKILWMRFQSPIVIYDSLAWGALAKRGLLKGSDGYREYLYAWRAAYQPIEDDVRSAAHELVAIKRFTLAADTRDQDLSKLVSNDWFCERVFDHWLISGAENTA